MGDVKRIDFSPDPLIREIQERRAKFDIQLAREKRRAEIEVDNDLEDAYRAYEDNERKEQKEKLRKRKAIVGGFVAFPLLFVIGISRFGSIKFFIVVAGLTIGCLFLKKVFASDIGDFNLESRVRSGMETHQRLVNTEVRIAKKVRRWF